MRMEAYEWKSSQPLAEQYRKRFSLISGRFDYDPMLQESWNRRAVWLDEQETQRVDREAFAEWLEKYNRSVGNNAEPVMNAIGQYRHNRALTVVGGQQAGLFSGPLLVIHKAITVIQSAREAAKRLGRPVIPVFWIAGEDHDYDEVNHVYGLTQELQVHKIKIDRKGEERTSVSLLEIDPASWENAILQMEASLIDTEYKPHLSRKLRDIAGQSKTLSDYFARMLAWLFGRFGLVLMDSADPGLRSLEAPMFTRLIEHNESISAKLLTGQAEVEALGFKSQLELQDDCANLFVLDESERRLLFLKDGAYSDKKGRIRLTREELLTMAARTPERLSNNAATRPIMQDYVLPVLSAVLGPSEIAYWALLREAFHELGLQLPILQPRTEFTLLEGTLQKHMAKYALSFDDVVRRFDERLTGWLQQQDQLNLHETFAEVKEQVKDLYEPVIKKVALVQQGLEKLGETNLHKIIEQIEYLENRAADAHRNRHEAAVRQLERIRLSLFPQGKPQERVYNVLMFLNKYGDQWLKELIGQELDSQQNHYLVYL